VVTVTRLDFTSTWRDAAIAFSVFRAEQDGVIAAGASPEQAVKALAVALAEQEEPR
jgi:hypothetical protein